MPSSAPSDSAATVDRQGGQTHLDGRQTPDLLWLALLEALAESYRVTGWRESRGKREPDEGVPVYAGGLTARLTELEDAFGSDPRYWQMRCLIDRVVPDHSWEIDSDVLAKLEELAFSDQETALMLSNLHPDIYGGSTSGEERFLKHAARIEPFVSLYPQQSVPLYSQARWWWEYDRLDEARAAIQAGNRRPRFDYSPGFPKDELYAELRKGNYPGGEELCGILWQLFHNHPNSFGGGNVSLCRIASREGDYETMQALHISACRGCLAGISATDRLAGLSQIRHIYLEGGERLLRRSSVRSREMPDDLFLKLKDVVDTFREKFEDDFYLVSFPTADKDLPPKRKLEQLRQGYRELGAAAMRDAAWADAQLPLIEELAAFDYTEYAP